MEVQNWHGYAVANLHLEWYHNEGENFCACHTLAEIWAQVCEPKLKWESNK
jgi:hypothetical protein